MRFAAVAVRRIEHLPFEFFELADELRIDRSGFIAAPFIERAVFVDLFARSRGLHTLFALGEITQTVAGAKSPTTYAYFEPSAKLA